MSSSEIPQPHDALFRHTFGQIQEAISFFQSYLPEVITSALQWDKMRLLNASFVDEDLKKWESDMLYEIPWTDKAAGDSDEPAARSLYLYILLEHQSTPYRKMPRRLLKYLMLAWDHFERDHPTTEGLPPIIPFVLAQTPGGWKFSRHFHDQIQWPKSAEIREFLKAYQPGFEHGLLDLTGTPFTALIGAPVLRLTLGLLKVRRQNDDGAWMDWMIPVIADVETTERGRMSLPTLLRYLFNIPELKPEEFQAKVTASPLFDKTSETIMTLADHFRNEGLTKGIQQGRQEGHQEGRQEGRLEGLQQGRIDMVQTLQALLGQPVDSSATLALQSIGQLDLLIQRLKQNFKKP